MKSKSDLIRNAIASYGVELCAPFARPSYKFTQCQSVSDRATAARETKLPLKTTAAYDVRNNAFSIVKQYARRSGLAVYAERMAKPIFFVDNIYIGYVHLHTGVNSSRFQESRNVRGKNTTTEIAYLSSIYNEYAVVSSPRGVKYLYGLA